MPFIFVQCDMGNGRYDLVNGQTGEIYKENVTARFCDSLFKYLDSRNIVYVRQFY